MESGSSPEPEDAELTGAIMGEEADEYAEPAAVETESANWEDVTAGTNSETEITTDPVITEEQCAEISQKIVEYGVENEKFLAFLNVVNLSDLPQRSYDMALAGLESKRRANETAAKKAADAEQKPQKSAPAPNMSGMLAMLAAKSLSPQIDEERGLIYVKIAYGDDANKTFLKANGFKWDAPGKAWKWSK